MNLNKFETKLNIDNYTKDDVRELLNYTFKLKEKNEEIMQIIAKPNEEFVECPHCNCTYSNVSVGDYFECGGCESYLYVEVDEKGELYIK